MNPSLPQSFSSDLEQIVPQIISSTVFWFSLDWTGTGLTEHWLIVLVYYLY